MRQSYVFDRTIMQLVPKDQFYAARTSGPMVIPDIGAYRSMVTGEMIEGRRAHREHLSRHNVVEVGDAYDKAPPPKPNSAPAGLKEQIARVVYDKLRY
jgi:hypothetical protein